MMDIVLYFLLALGFAYDLFRGLKNPAPVVWIQILALYIDLFGFGIFAYQASQGVYGLLS